MMCYTLSAFVFVSTYVASKSIEAEMVSKRLNVKSMEDMGCRNEG